MTRSPSSQPSVKTNFKWLQVYNSATITTLISLQAKRSSTNINHSRWEVHTSHEICHGRQAQEFCIFMELSMQSMDRASYRIVMENELAQKQVDCQSFDTTAACRSMMSLSPSSGILHREIEMSLHISTGRILASYNGCKTHYGVFIWLQDAFFVS